jgi:hypothetical protein
MRGSALQKILIKMQIDHNIIPSAIDGYDTLASTVKEDSSASMEEHPGFKRMIQLLNEDIHEIRSWMQSGTITTNKSGVLWVHISSIDLNSLSKGQLVKRVQKWESIGSELERLKNMNAMLSEHNAALIDRKPLPSTHTILTKYRVYKPLRDVMKIVGQLSKKLNEPPSHDGSGEIYAAVNPLMPHLYKMGFTFKDAETRVKALQTAGVLELFELIRCVRVADAR